MAPRLAGAIHRGALQRRFVHGPGVDEPVVWYEGSGTSDRRWLHQDRLGSVIAISNSSGAATSINTYDEYGVPGSGNAGRFQYTGQMWIPEAALYHYKARAYAPGLGRFLQTDPILYAGGMNLYAYVANDPVNSSDPTGNWGMYFGVDLEGSGAGSNVLGASILVYFEEWDAFSLANPRGVFVVHGGIGYDNSMSLIFGIAPSGYDSLLGTAYYGEYGQGFFSFNVASENPWEWDPDRAIWQGELGLGPEFSGSAGVTRGYPVGVSVRDGIINIDVSSFDLVMNGAWISHIRIDVRRKRVTAIGHVPGSRLIRRIVLYDDDETDSQPPKKK